MIFSHSFRSLIYSTCVFCLVAGGLQTSAVAKSPALQKGDRIVFLGDSITQQGNGGNGYVVQVRRKIAALPGNLGIEVIGAGISGHKVPNLQSRLDRDVIAKKPTAVVIYIGINDVWHSTNGRGTSKEAFESGLRDLIKRIVDAKARVILCTPSVIGEKVDGSNNLDKMLDEYSDISRRVAKETGSQLLDLRQRFEAELKKSNLKNDRQGVLTGDGVHLNQAGNTFVANQMLEALGVVDESNKRLLRHVVLFKFKDGTKPSQVAEVVKAFGNLPAKIDAIHDFEWGLDVSVEGKAQGFTHGFLVTFRNEQDRETYLPHPAHKEFVSLVGPHIEDVLVFDYWTKE